MAEDAFWLISGSIKNYSNSKETPVTELRNESNPAVFPVLKYACESWTLNNNLTGRINAFEQWCYHRHAKSHASRGRLMHFQLTHFCPLKYYLTHSFLCSYAKFCTPAFFKYEINCTKMPNAKHDLCVLSIL